MIEEKKDYYSNGQLEEHYFEKDGDLYGEYKTYYQNGQLERHCFFKDDKLHGEYKHYYEDGTCRFHEIYVENEDLNINPATLSKEDKLALKLKHNIEFLPE